MTGLLRSWAAAVAALYGRGEEWMLGTKHATYGVSAARVVYGAVVVGFVAANFGVRGFLWGPGSAWVSPIEHQTTWSFPFVFYSSSDPEWLFTLKFLLLAIAGLALMLGWHSRISAIVVLYLYICLVSTNPVAYDQTDNAFRILLLYFCLADLSGHWSLDARRRARRAARYRTDRPAPASRLQRAIPPWVPIALHNAAIIAVALQLFIIYGIAGLAKVAGSQWADGTAVYYPLQLDSLNPWPWLSDLVTANALFVTIATYIAVYVEIFFAFMLLTRWTRILALVGIVGMHLGIAVLMGLPFFSLSMMAADGIFVRDVTWRKAETWVRRKAGPLVLRGRQRLGLPPPAGAGRRATAQHTAPVNAPANAPAVPADVPAAS